MSGIPVRDVVDYLNDFEEACCREDAAVVRTIRDDFAQRGWLAPYALPVTCDHCDHCDGVSLCEHPERKAPTSPQQEPPAECPLRRGAA